MQMDDSKIGKLIETHEGFVKALALRWAPLPGEKDDIAQQVFLEFLKKRDKWDLEQDLRPLLAGMTKNVCRRYWRERMHDMPEKTKALAEHLRGLAEEQEVSWYTEEDKSTLRECLGKMGDKDRKIVSLHYELNLSTVDLSQELSLNTNAVRQALFRIREKLRACMTASLKRSAYG
ncbi:MAG: hypothetical protein C0404_06770 [Verrucomicrobia bacterium]|nr:hypothetical protein [Verrucomicrobiota bacterium]